MHLENNSGHNTQGPILIEHQSYTDLEFMTSHACGRGFSEILQFLAMWEVEPSKVRRGSRPSHFTTYILFKKISRYSALWENYIYHTDIKYPT